MGQNKALMEFRGETLISRVVKRVERLAGEILVTTNQPEEFQFLQLPLFPDLIKGAGALGGLYTALSSASLPYTAVLACDLPFVSSELIETQYLMMLASHSDVVIPRSPDGLEPLHAVYRRERCQPAVHAALDAGKRRMISWLEDVKWLEMSPEEIARVNPDYRSFININTPEEFRAAEELVE